MSLHCFFLILCIIKIHYARQINIDILIVKPFLLSNNLKLWLNVQIFSQTHALPG